MVNITPWTLYPARGPQLPLNRGLGGFQHRCGQLWRREKFVTFVIRNKYVYNYK